MKNKNISGDTATDEIEYGLESIYPMQGGLKENVQWFCGDDVFVRQVEGGKHAYEFLKNYALRVSAGKKLPFMIDALNCGEGCVYGTGIKKSKKKSDDIIYSLQDIKQGCTKSGHKGPWSKKNTPQQRLKRLNHQFKHLKLDDFVRYYED